MGKLYAPGLLWPRDVWRPWTRLFPLSAFLVLLSLPLLHVIYCSFILPMAVLNVGRDSYPSFPCMAAGMANSCTPPVKIILMTGNCFSFWGLLGCLLLRSRNNLALLLSNSSSPGSEQTTEDVRVVYINSGLLKQCSVHKCWLWRVVVVRQKHSWSLFSLILFLPLTQVVI